MRYTIIDKVDCPVCGWTGYLSDSVPNHLTQVNRFPPGHPMEGRRIKQTVVRYYCPTCLAQEKKSLLLYRDKVNLWNKKEAIEPAGRRIII